MSRDAELTPDPRLADIDAGFAELRQDPVAWRRELEEREGLDGTLSDDLGDEEDLDATAGPEA